MASIRELRESRGLTRTQLAELCHVSLTAVRHWEIGDNKPSLLFQKILFKIFGVTPDECQYPRGPYTSPTCLRNLRETRKISRVKLSKMLGVTVDTILNWEINRHVPTELNAKKLTEFFGVVPDECKPHENPALSPTSIHALRIARGMSLSQLGELCGRESNSVCQWETGVNTPTPLMRQKLRDIFGVTPDECRNAERTRGSSTSLRALRETLGLTQSELSKALGVEASGRTISSWELGISPPSDLSRARLRKFFGVTPDECRRRSKSPLPPTSIKSLRVAHDLTMKELAEMCGVSRGNVANWEIGNCKPNPEHSKKLHEIFGIMPDECLARIVPKTLTVKPDWRVGAFFTFIPKQPQNKRRKSETLKLKSRTEKFLIFTDSAGCTQTFTPSQLQDFTSVTPATEQDIARFEAGEDFFD